MIRPIRPWDEAKRSAEKTARDPRPAGNGAGCFLAFTAVCVSSEEGRIPLKAVPAALSWCFFVFAFIYGNAMNAQENYTVFRTEMILSDLQSLPLSPVL